MHCMICCICHCPGMSELNPAELQSETCCFNSGSYFSAPCCSLWLRCGKVSAWSAGLYAHVIALKAGAAALLCTFKPTWGAGWELQLLLLPRGPSRQCLQQGYACNCCVFLMPLSPFEMGHWDASFRLRRAAIDIDETASFLFQQRQALSARVQSHNMM